MTILKPDGAMMKFLLRCFTLIHGLMAALFTCAALILIGIAARIGSTVFSSHWDEASALIVIEALGVLAGAVVAMQIAETIVEEEVIREADVSAPTRVRRFVSRFLVVVVVALAVEGLVATFKALHEDPSQLWYASGLIASTALLIASWGIFVHLNRSAEELEPEAMEDAKREDKKGPIERVRYSDFRSNANRRQLRARRHDDRSHGQ